MFPEHPARLTVHVTFAPVSLKSSVESFCSCEALNPVKLMPLRVMVWGALAPKLMAWWALVPLLNVMSSSKPVGFVATFQMRAEASAATVGTRTCVPVILEPAAVIALQPRNVLLKQSVADKKEKVSMPVKE